MDRIGPAGGSPLGTLYNGDLGFQDENLSTGVEGTTVVAAWLNALQEELMNILDVAGVTPNIENFGQINAALQIIYGGGGTMGTASSAPGWQRLPGGLIIQWGIAAFAASDENTAAETVYFPTTFLTNCFAVVGTPLGNANSSSGDIPAFSATFFTPSHFTANIASLPGDGVISDAVNFNYIALGI